MTEAKTVEDLEKEVVALKQSVERLSEVIALLGSSILKSHELIAETVAYASAISAQRIAKFSDNDKEAWFSERAETHRSAIFTKIDESLQNISRGLSIMQNEEDA